MNENKYTPEPWRTDAECGFPQDIHDSKGNLFLRCGSDFDNEIYGEANARRITACVNACAGVETGHLEKYGLPDFAQKISDLREQRDELLAALERCRFALEPYDDIKPRDWKSDRLNLRDAHQVAVAAIARAKREQ